MIRFLFVLFTLLQFCYADLDVIVMPFHKRQLKKLLFNLESWKTFPPTSKESKNVELVIYNSGLVDVDLEKEIMNFFKDNPKISNYFTNISVQFALLRGIKDSYYRGTRAMFESLLLRGNTLKYSNPNVNYVFYMEPDCLPIKAHWLDVINDEIKATGGDFWMIGSKYEGEIRWFGLKTDDFLNHLNGNSIYNIGSQEFQQFYRQEILPIYPKAELVPYDLKISQVLYANNSALLHKFGDKFKSTRVIVNTGGATHLLSNIQNTFMQHISDNWDGYWRFYQKALPTDDHQLLERLKSLVSIS